MTQRIHFDPDARGAGPFSGPGPSNILDVQTRQLLGKKCPYCNAENVWLTDYIDLGAPNVECKSCGENWIESPETKLYIKSNGSGKVGTDPPKQKLEVYSGEAKVVGVKDNLLKSKPIDLYVSGIVRRVEEATYDYADIKDENHNSMLTIPLLEFEGKCVEVIVSITDYPSNKQKVSKLTVNAAGSVGLYNSDSKSR